MNVTCTEVKSDYGKCSNIKIKGTYMCNGDVIRALIGVLKCLQSNLPK